MTQDLVARLRERTANKLVFRPDAELMLEAADLIDRLSCPAVGEALKFAQGEIAVAMAFLGRGPGPERITVPPTPSSAEAWSEMCRQIYQRLAVADSRARAALAASQPTTPTDAQREALTQCAEALDAMMNTWLDYHDAHSLTEPVTGASGNAFDKALEARDAAEAAIAASQPQASRDSVLEEAACAAEGLFAEPGWHDFIVRGARCAAGAIRALKDKSTPPPISAEEERANVIVLTKAEIQSGLDRVRWAEGLIRQLPKDHDGRNSWLLNYGQRGDHNQPELPGDVGGEG